MNKFWKDNGFLKAYALTIVQIILFVVLSFFTYMLIVMSMSSVYPFLQIISQIQNAADISGFVDPFFQNEVLFTNFIASLITIILSYTIIMSGILSFFDYLIINQLKKNTFKFKEWLLDWFNYASMALLLLIIFSVLFYTIENILLLTFLLFFAIIIFCYIVILMQFKKNLIYAIRKTILGALLLLLYYLILFLITLLFIGWFAWFGFLIGFLLFMCLLVWSKVYLLKKL